MCRSRTRCGPSSCAATRRASWVWSSTGERVVRRVPRGAVPGMTPASPAAFRLQVEQGFEDHAPKKGDPGDFSSAHIVTGTSVEQFQDNERLAFEVTRRWQRTLFEGGLAG